MSDQTYVVEREETASAGRYVIHLAPGVDGEMTFRKTGPNTITVDHTGTPPEYRGQGLAQLLMYRLIADAKADGTKIVPLCSYVAAQFRRHPEWAGLLAA
jgi:predicted GNAT family acetyltransferase